jgi:hypothetical protein
MTSDLGHRAHVGNQNEDLLEHAPSLEPAASGVHDARLGLSRNRLSIEYDPSMIDHTKIMCRYGVYPEPISPRPNGPLGHG